MTLSHFIFFNRKDRSGFFYLFLTYLYTINFLDVVKIVRCILTKQDLAGFLCNNLDHYTEWLSLHIFIHKIVSLSTKFDWKTQNSDYLLETKLANCEGTTEIWDQPIEWQKIFREIKELHKRTSIGPNLSIQTLWDITGVWDKNSNAYLAFFCRFKSWT